MITGCGLSITREGKKSGFGGEGQKWITGLSRNNGSYLAGLFGELDAML